MQENSTFKETTLQDYLPLIYNEFPDIPQKDIKIILEYGWRLLYLANIAGCDTLVKSQKYGFWFYIGNLCISPLLHFNYYKKKLISKIRFIFNREKIPFDGTYYTGLTEEEYKKQFNSRGRKRNKFTFTNKLAFRSKDSACIYYFNCLYIIQFTTNVYHGFLYKSDKLNIVNPKVVLIKESSTFKDILVLNNDYDLI